ncbi:hypothetical protein NQ318_008947 [Aromia moschata]|uniref:RNase H type-1 domain-containing protein n=1 Tax=Aromia moschata TaxID=1265417 RepID=A0AAV8ZD35_9CUCU|nr:hypothetical protein NQ318_008947 [Aromia moschata]
MEVDNPNTRPKRPNVCGAERKRRRKARLAKEATTTVVPPQQPQPSSSTNVEGTVKLDPPAVASGSSTGATSSVVGATGRPRGSYGPRRTEAPAKKRQRTPGSTPDAAGASKRPKPGTPRSWQAGFAQVVSGDKSLQIVIGREGQTELPFSESQLLEFLDAVREAITVTPTTSETPLQFRSTTLWRGQLLVNAANAASRDWLLRSLNNIRPWSDVRLVALDPQTLRLRRALVIRGSPAPNGKFGVGREEPQGLGLVVGIDEKSIPTLERLDFQPYFSATRARVTLTARHTKSKGGTAKAGTAKADTSHAPNEEEGSAEAEPPNPAEFIQANIQHGKAQSAFLCKRIIECQIKIALIQEPWVYHGKVRGLGRAGGTVYYCPSAEEPRACILVKGAKGVFPMPGLCTRDLAVIKLAIGNWAAAARWLRLQLPPHYVGDKEVKPRGRMLLEFLTLSGMQIANRGSVPTYFTPERQSVIDLTLCSTELLSQVVSWRVSLEVSLSDHRHIFFGLDESTQLIENGYRNPRATQWDLYLEDLKGRLIGIPSRYESEADVEVVLNRLNSAIVESFEANCPLKQRTSSSKTPWWNSHVESHRRKVIRDSIRDTWRASCEDIIQLPSAARLSKVLTKDPGAKLGAVSLPDGGFTSSAGETLQHLLSAMRSAYRLTGLGHWIGEEQTTGHATIWNKATEHCPVLLMLQDSVEPTICPSPKLGIQIPSRDDWDNTNNTICQNGIIWFTDGSKIGDKAGAGVYGKTTRTKLSFALGSCASVFQAEIYAILACGMEILKTAPKRRTIQICTDSQAALMAIESSKVKSRLVLDCKKILNDLASCNRVILT